MYFKNILVLILILFTFINCHKQIKPEVEHKMISPNETKPNPIKYNMPRSSSSMKINHFQKNKNETIIDEKNLTESMLLDLYEKDKTDFVILIKIIQFYTKIENYDLALKYIYILKKTNPEIYIDKGKDIKNKIFQNLFKQAYKNYKINNFNKSAKIYNYLLTLFPNKTEIYSELYKVYKKLDKSYSFYLRVFERLKESPEDFYLFYTLGLYYFDEDNTEKAKYYFEKAYEKDPDSITDLSIKLSLIYEKTNDFTEGNKVLSRLYNLNPKNLVVMMRYAFFNEHFYKYKESVKFYTKIFNFYDNDKNLLERAIQTAFAAGAYKESVKFCEKLIVLDEKSLNSWLLLSKAYTLKGDYTSAWRCNEKIRELR